jgi:predicted house-cleaning noncanonical NTP pyrophosphatase (MazG superfamily)
MRKLVKLVRDSIMPPGVEYTAVHDQIYSHEEHVRLLRRKLIEEAIEYFEKPTREELADVLQVINDLVFIDLRSNMGRLESERLTKYADRGGFEGGTAMFISYDDHA